jgi:dipeptidyl aminopeptidase/acylaminoacyl peptidase
MDAKILTTALAATVLAAPGAPARAAFPGANGKIAFDSFRNGSFEVFAMDPDGSDPVNLTRNPASDSDPAWSPDGRLVAFTSDRDGNGEVYVLQADGTGQTRLTNNPAADFEPAWSPDGAHLAFTSNRDGNLEVYVMNADGTGVTRLITNTVDLAVHHGGSGTILGALVHGTPQVLVPKGADQFWNADLMARAGLAAVLEPAHVTADAVGRAAATELASDRAAIGAVRQEIAAMPHPSDVLEQLAARIGWRSGAPAA